MISFTKWPVVGPFFDLPAEREDIRDLEDRQYLFLDLSWSPQARGRHQMLVIGHRGDTTAAAENSAASIRAAAHAGADWVEVDVRPTADGQLVLAHDAMLSGLEVIASSLDELRTGYPELATLDEGLSASDGLAGINLELKPPVPMIESFLRRLGESCSTWTGELLISSFFIPLIQEVRTLLPDFETGVLSGASYDPDGRIAVEAALELECGTVLPEDSAVTKQLIDEAHEARKRVTTWTVNDRERVRTLVDWGIDGVITDDIGMARAVVDLV